MQRLAVGFATAIHAGLLREFTASLGEPLDAEPPDPRDLLLMRELVGNVLAAYREQGEFTVQDYARNLAWALEEDDDGR
jgi:hypothetical protein